jgi:hypothetical protein
VEVKKQRSRTNLLEIAASTLQEVSLEAIASTASYIIYSSTHGLISEHEKPSDAVVAFFQYASSQVKAGGGRLPGIYKRSVDGWVKI